MTKKRIAVYDSEDLQTGLAVVRGLGRAGEDLLVYIEEVGYPVPGGRRYVLVDEIGEADPEDYDKYPVMTR